MNDVIQYKDLERTIPIKPVLDLFLQIEQLKWQLSTVETSFPSNAPCFDTTIDFGFHSTLKTLSTFEPIRFALSSQSPNQWFYYGDSTTFERSKQPYTVTDSTNRVMKLLKLLSLESPS